MTTDAGQAKDASSSTVGGSQGPTLPRNVFWMGWTSLLADVSTEMIYPFYSAFVARLLSAQAARVGPIVGLVEGIAESTAAFLRVFSGHLSDRLRRRKPLAVLGYGLSAVSRLWLLLAALGWPFLLVGRVMDRVGKGIRTAPRDALVAESTLSRERGWAFGWHRAFDFTGAAIGAALGWGWAHWGLRHRPADDLRAFQLAFAASMVPGLLAVLMLGPVRESQTGRGHSGIRAGVPVSWSIRVPDQRLRWFLVIQALFSIGRFSNQFLLLRSQQLGMSLSMVLLMYLAFNLVTPIPAILFGRWSDRVGRRMLLLVGYLLYAGIYLGFAALTPASSGWLWALWLLYGIYHALTEGAEKALVAELSPPHLRATTLGIHQMIVALGLLAASTFAGVLYRWSPSAPFIFGGLTALTASLLLLIAPR